MKKNKQTNNYLGIPYFLSDTKRVKNYNDLEYLAFGIQHGLQGFIVKRIEGESTETNDFGQKS